MQLTDLTVEVRDKTLTRVGLIRPEDLTLSAQINFNNVGSWTLTMPTEHPLTPTLRTPGSGIIVTYAQDVLFSGPVLNPALTASSDDPAGTVTISGVTDDIVLNDRLCYPQPTNGNAATQTQAHDAHTAVSEDLMLYYVNGNAGPGAPAVRQTPHLTLAASQHRGTVQARSARFQTLGSFLSDIALVDSMGFRVVQRGPNLVFEVYQVEDLTHEIRLDIWHNTLAKYELSITAPTATQVIVAGSGEEVNRAFYVGTNAAAAAAETAWNRRIEVFVDQRQSDDPNEYVSAANDVLATEGSTQTAAVFTPMDDATMRFGYDWNVGDKIAAVGDDGEYTAIVSSVALSVSSEGCKLGAIMGDPTKLASVGDPWVDRLMATQKRVDALERAT